jgi:hypothetical protein
MNPKFNIALVKGRYNTERLRFNVALWLGLTANIILHRNRTFYNIFMKQILDCVWAKEICGLIVGLIPSHIGFESAMAKIVLV